MNVDLDRLRFDPLCFAELAEDGNHFTQQFEADELIAAVGDLDQMTAAQIAAAYERLKLAYDDIEAARATMSKFIELVKNVKLPEAFERESLTTITLKNGSRVTVQQRTMCQVIGDTSEAHKWLQENGYPDAVKPTVNAGTLGSIAKEILSGNAEGVFDLPDDLFKVTIRPTTSVTKSRK